MKTMADNHDLYFKTEVLLLADVFEGFRSFCLANYELYPCLVFHRFLDWLPMLYSKGRNKNLNHSLI